MNQGGDRISANMGFTIVETLIVLAVSGGLLLSAILLINGRQNKTEFTTGINGLQQQFQQIINQTASGYYPNNQSFTCTPQSTGPAQLSIGGANTLGTNGDCIFIGTVLRFGGSDGADNFTMYPLAANRLKPGTSDEVTGLTDTWPTAISKGSTYNSRGPESSSNYVLAHGLTYVGRSVNGGAVSPAGTSVLAAAFITSFPTITNTTLDPGSQQFSLYGFSNQWTSTNNADNIDNAGKKRTGILNYYSPYTQIGLCFASGGTNQSGLITLGSSNGGLSVTTQIKSTRTCT